MKLHHVVFCVHHRNLERAAELWRDLGLTFAEIDLADLGIKVLIDWNAGIELVSPVPGSGQSAAVFTTFLENRGEGVYSVVMAVDEVGGAVAIAQRYGVQVEYSQHRQHGSLTIDEVMLAPVHGMPITFLSTVEQT
jgi:methylmalonyl-CoA/ethylmalonyl-CoA epimerase